MTGMGDQDGSFVRLGDVVVQIAQVARAKQRSRAASTSRVVDLEAAPPTRRRATVAVLAVLVDAKVIDAGTASRLLKRTLAAGASEPCREARDQPGPP